MSKPDYKSFLLNKSQVGSNTGFEPLWIPDFLFDFQKHLVEWAIRKGRAALFEDCGLGKTVQYLVWAENVARKTGGNVLVLDEPTNDLDLPSLRMLEEALADFDGSVIVVSHDRYFLDRICDQIVAFEDNGVVVQPGNYSYYLEKRQARENAQRVQAQAAAREAEARRKAATGAPSSGKSRKLTNLERRDLDTIEDTILNSEREVAGLEALLNDPDFQLTRFAEAPAVLEQLEQARARTAALYSRWEQLESLRAEIEG